MTETLGELPERLSIHLDRGYDSKATRESGWKSGGCSPRSPRRASRPRWPPRSGVDSAAHQFVAQRSQEARVVYGASGAGDRLLGGFLGCDHHRAETHPRSLGALPLGDPTFSPTMT